MATVYKFVNKLNNECLYVGSTFNYNRRIRDHKSNCNNIKTRCYNYPIYKYIRNLTNQINDIEFVIILTMNTDNKKELHSLEAKFINELRPLCNKYIPNRTIKQYRIDNKVNSSNYNRKYNINNKEKIKEHNNKKNICDICNGKYTTSNKTRHNKSKKHIKLTIKLIN